MKIVRFVGKSVNGYMNFDIHFFDRLTFITGINGSGKTSVLNSIAALLLPRLDYLSGEYFDEISIELMHDDETVTLSATKNDSATILTCTSHPECEFRIVAFVPPEPMSVRRAREYEKEYYQDVLARNSENPIIGYIESLPTPMYLGVDRRSITATGGRPRYGSRGMGSSRVRRNIFGRTLEVGLGEALYFARQHMEDVRLQEMSLDAQIRERLVLELIDFPPISFTGDLAKPTAADLRKFKSSKVNLKRLPELLNVDEDVISKKLNPVMEFLDDTLRRIRRVGTKDTALDVAIFEWSFNKTNIDKLSTLSETISEYNNEVKSIRMRINDYLRTVNEFMHDSGKKITFSGVGELRFMLEDDESNKERPIDTLSSGEVQLVVILTHLYFNPEVETANVFIIDEPELSLHVQWQEKFVDGITEASKSTQFILATHSPTIILDRTENCREISQA